MGIVTPLSGGDSGVWSDELNTALSVIDAHDHTSGKGVKVPVSGLNINADISLSGTYALTNIKDLAFSAVTALTAGSKCLFVNTADNELYWRTNAGTNVKLTSGTSINTTLVGGIVGDYTAVGATVAFDDANDRYTFKQQGSPAPWARLASADVRIYPTGGTGTLYTGLKCNAGIGASYDLTFASALPAGGVFMQVDNTGAITYSTTLPANTNITLSGTGYLKRGNAGQTKPFVGSAAQVASGSVTTTAGQVGCVQAISTTAYYPVIMNNELERLQSIKLFAPSTGNSPTYTLYGGSTIGIMAPVPGATVTANTSTITLTPTTPGTVAQGATYYVKVVTDGSTTVNMFSYSITADVP